ncbi:hypothetical protein [Marinobacter bohaiensis]|uniref:hypothetical protein n=1 Tax=Marinobacter bohaiensis TaxID=2201898 RepID=UPI000DAB5735|nr:hypothetical protein [Marinobacter bohaiensis]
MLRNSVVRLKQVERPLTILAQALVGLFWLCAGVEVYKLYVARSSKEPEYLFFTMGGGVFAALLYLFIAYFCALKTFQKTSPSERVPKRFVHIQEIGAIVVATFFIYATAATVFDNLTH